MKAHPHAQQPTQPPGPPPRQERGPSDSLRYVQGGGVVDVVAPEQRRWLALRRLPRRLLPRRSLLRRAPPRQPSSLRPHFPRTCHSRRRQRDPWPQRPRPSASRRRPASASPARGPAYGPVVEPLRPGAMAEPPPTPSVELAGIARHRTARRDVPGPAQAGRCWCGGESGERCRMRAGAAGVERAPIGSRLAMCPAAPS